MLPKFRTRALAALTAGALALGAAAPAQAFGKNERKFLQGVAAALIVGAIVNDARNRAQAQPRQALPRQVQQYYYEPQASAPPVYRDQSYHAAPTGRVIGSTMGGASAHVPPVHASPAAQAFNAYSPAQRRAIQARLKGYGYYAGAIDGAFGPATYRAVLAYARDTGGERQIADRGAAFGLYDGLIL
jgi:hypothetical protein